MTILSVQHQAIIKGTILYFILIFNHTVSFGAAVVDHREYIFQIAEVNEPSARLQLEDDPRTANYNFDAYSIDLIIDPCRGHSHDCCWNTFGTPEYIRQPRSGSLGWVWALSKQGRAFKCQKPCSGHWETPEDEPGVYDYTFRWLDADDEFVWALGAEGNAVFKRTLDGTTPWEFISGTPIQTLTTSGTHAVFATTNTGALRECRKPCSGEWDIMYEPEGHPNAGEMVLSPAYVAEDGSSVESTAPDPAEADGSNANSPRSKIVAIDGDSTHLWVLTSTGRLLTKRLYIGDTDKTQRWEDVTDSHWVDVTPKLFGNVIAFTLSLAAKKVFVITASGTAECTSPCLGDNWQTITSPDYDKPLVQLDAGQVNVFAVAEDGMVFVHRINSVVRSGWSAVPSNVKSERDNPRVIAAHATVPAGGMSHIAVSSNLILIEDFEVYVVERHPGVCLGASSQESCLAIEDEGCRWSEENKACEKLLEAQYSRLQDKEVVFNDETCIILEGINHQGIMVRRPGYALVESQVGAELEVVADDDCVADGVRRVMRDAKPVCWDHNTTVSATQHCYDIDGTQHPFCMNIGFSSSATIVQCNGGFDCGTFIEVHSRNSDEILSEVRIPVTSDFTSGHRTMAVSLLYPKLDSDREIWLEKMRSDEDYEDFDMDYETAEWGKSAITFDFLNKAQWRKELVDILNTRSQETSDRQSDTSTVNSNAQTGSGTLPSNSDIGKSQSDKSSNTNGNVGDSSRNNASPLPRDIVIDHTSAQRSNYVLCRGDYELWWVQRTRHKFIVEFIKPFRIDSPLCDFDESTDTYKSYRTVNGTLLDKVDAQ